MKLYSSTWVQAIEEGILIDLSEFAPDVGIENPVAVSREVFHELSNTLYSKEDIINRIYILLVDLSCAIHDCSGREFYFAPVFLSGEISRVVPMRAKFGVGDHLEPVIMVVLEDEKNI